MKQAVFSALCRIFAKKIGICMVFSVAFLVPEPSQCAEQIGINDKLFFTLDNRLDLRAFGGQQVKRLLTRVKGKGEVFSVKQALSYCKLKKNSQQIQWVVNDLQTGEIISKSANANKLFFGASVSKLFVAAALLHKQQGKLNKAQLNQLVKMIVVSDNYAWKALQREVGDDGTNDSGRAAVDKFVQHMGYADIKGFQGWLNKKDGTKIHGNELNTIQLSNFLHDTYQGNYAGAKVLWKIMHATKTGRRKIDKYTPSHIYIGGKTGTYHGPNASPETVRLPTVRAHNHAAVLEINDKYYGISILSNTGSSEDVAILAGGLMREYLGVGERINCL